MAVHLLPVSKFLFKLSSCIFNGSMFSCPYLLRHAQSECVEYVHKTQIFLDLISPWSKYYRIYPDLIILCLQFWRIETSYNYYSCKISNLWNKMQNKCFFSLHCDKSLVHKIDFLKFSKLLDLEFRVSSCSIKLPSLHFFTINHRAKRL